MKIFYSILITFLIIVIPAYGAPYIDDQDFKIEKYFDGIFHPTAIHFIGNDMFVLEQSGDVRLIRNETLYEEPILHLNVNSENERGLLGITSLNSSVFLYFSEADPDSGALIANRIYKYDWDGQELLNPVLIHDLPMNFKSAIHNGGSMVTGLDGTVYAVIGDALLNGLSQNIKEGEFEDSGVILYVDTSGLTPKPRLSDTPEKFYHAIGIRNSFGLAIDPKTGYLWDTENGPDSFDEINLVLPKFNSGWKKVMGPATQKQKESLADYQGFEYSDPEFSWKKPVGPTALTFVQSNLFEKYEDNLLVGDFHTGSIYKFKLNEKRTGFDFDDPNLEDKILNVDDDVEGIIFASGFSGVTDVEFGPDGFLYVASWADWTIYRIIPSDLLEDQIKIPKWFKKNTLWWENNEIDDNTFFQGIKYLIENYVIILAKIPDIEKDDKFSINSFKENTTNWELDKISDEEYSDSIESVIKQGIFELDENKIRCNFPPRQALDLSGCDLSGRDFSRMDLSHSKMNNSVLNGANFFSTDLRNTDLSFSKLIKTNLENAKLTRAKLVNAELQEAFLFTANLNRVDLSRANLFEANLTQTKIQNAILVNTNLKHADLSDADLRFSDFKFASLEFANLMNANLIRADLRGANLTGAILINADLTGAKLTNTNFSDAITKGCSGCPDLLDSTQYSLKEIQKIIRNHYLEFLEREPDKSGLDHYTEQILSGKIKLEELESIFLNSEEYKNKKLIQK